MQWEEAFYHKIMLMEGLDDGYDEWLNGYLEAEDPLSDIVLELAYCSSDVEKTISVLNDYCLEHAYDEAIVCEKARAFFQKAYDSGRMSREEIISSMHRLAQTVRDAEDADIDMDAWIKIWGDMYDLDDYYDLVKEGLGSSENFDSAFSAYLYDGTPLNLNRIWEQNSKEKTGLLDKIKRAVRGMLKR